MKIDQMDNQSWITPDLPKATDRTPTAKYMYDTNTARINESAFSDEAFGQRLHVGYKQLNILFTLVSH